VQLLAACAAGDLDRVAQLGWRHVLGALRMWPKLLGGHALEPYVIALGDEDPKHIAAAIRGFRGVTEYRPSPAEIYMRLHPAPRKSAQPAGVSARPDNSPTAYEAVLDWVAMGEETCDCVPRSPQFTIDAAGVLRCDECGRLEPGQYDQAIEWRKGTA
jgi:hypothetical protein